MSGSSSISLGDFIPGSVEINRNNMPASVAQQDNAPRLQDMPVEILVEIFKNLGNTNELKKACDDPEIPSSYPLNIKLALESTALIRDRLNIILEEENCTDTAELATKLKLDFTGLNNIEIHDLVMDKYQKDLEFYNSYAINSHSTTLGNFHGLTLSFSEKLLQPQKELLSEKFSLILENEEIKSSFENALCSNNSSQDFSNLRKVLKDNNIKIAYWPLYEILCQNQTHLHFDAIYEQFVKNLKNHIITNLTNDLSSKLQRCKNILNLNEISLEELSNNNVSLEKFANKLQEFDIELSIEKLSSYLQKDKTHLSLKELSEKLQQCRKDYVLIEFWKALPNGRERWINTALINSPRDVYGGISFQEMFAAKVIINGQNSYYEWNNFLILANKGLKELPPEINLFTNMREITLSNNSLEDISMLDFTILTSLTMINVNNNKIKDLSHLNGRNITELHASGNLIESIDGLNLPTANHINVSNNKLTKLENLNLPQATFFKASDNQLTEISANNHLPQVSSFGLNNNLLDTFPPNLAMPGLRYLHLNTNLFTELPRLRGYNGLWQAEIKGNKITHIPENYVMPNGILKIKGLFLQPLTYRALWNGRSIFYKITMPFKAMLITYSLIMGWFLKGLYLPFTIGKKIFNQSEEN